MEDLLEKHLQEIVELYFAGYSIKKALEVAKENERKLDGTVCSNN